MSLDSSFRCEVEHSSGAPKDVPLTTVKCHGRLSSENSDQIKAVVAPLIPGGGRIVIDVSDLSFLGSAGLGALVGLKISAIKHGKCTMQIANPTPRIQEVLRIGNLSEFLAS